MYTKVVITVDLGLQIKKNFTYKYCDFKNKVTPNLSGLILFSDPINFRPAGAYRVGSTGKGGGGGSELFIPPQEN